MSRKTVPANYCGDMKTLFADGRPIVLCECSKMSLNLTYMQYRLCDGRSSACSL